MLWVGSFDVGKAAVQVQGGGCFGEPGVACGDGLGDGRVLDGGRVQSRCVIGCEAADPDQVDPQAAHRLCEVGV